ncbi:hypothetical protein R75465_02215 [Paraburkholderia aspalathi]|uniref:hypothetical protein n=1 Tax=Paraburkholderia aspalathi TaxID=1324617 RepID=UPI001B27E0A5|nr:hypothetical protein [Paraburkholderia aspalathi]CAE6739797.1 hypothetical protein R75465_02215 [Paraburkholderia aspalathi]
MARTTINFPVGLARDGRVLGVSEKVGTTVPKVFHAMLALWMAAADQDVDDGTVPDMSAQEVDDIVDVDGLGDALLAVGLIAETAVGLEVCGYREAQAWSFEQDDEDGSGE